MNYAIAQWTVSGSWLAIGSVILFFSVKGILWLVLPYLLYRFRKIWMRRTDRARLHEQTAHQ